MADHSSSVRSTPRQVDNDSIHGEQASIQRQRQAPIIPTAENSPRSILNCPPLSSYSHPNSSNNFYSYNLHALPRRILLRPRNPYKKNHHFVTAASTTFERTKNSPCSTADAPQQDECSIEVNDARFPSDIYLPSL